MIGKRQVIAVDLDDVLSVNIPAFIEFSNKKWGTDLSVEDYKENWLDMWGIDAEEMNRRRRAIKEEFFTRLKPSVEGVPVLKELANIYKLVITTSRRTEVKDVTLNWIDKYFGGIFEEVHHARIFDGDIKAVDWSHANKKTKTRLYKEIGADFIIDDHLKHCIGADSAGITALLFGEYFWNTGAEIPESVVRVKDWKEVKDYFAARG